MPSYSQARALPIVAALTPRTPGAMLSPTFRGRTMASRADTGLWRESVRAGAKRSGALVASLALFALSLVLVLALASFDGRDAAIDTASGEVAHNLVGAPGAWLADLALLLFGPAVALLLPIPATVALRLWRDLPAGPWVRTLRNAVVGVALMGCALAFVSGESVLKLPGGWGGTVGLLFANGVNAALALADNPLVTLWGPRAVGLLVGVAGAVIWARALEIEWADWRPRGLPGRLPRLSLARDEDEPLTLIRKPVEPRSEPAAEARTTPERDDRPAPVIAERQVAPAAARPKPAVSGQAGTQHEAGHVFERPALDLLTPAPPAPKGQIDRAALDRNARLLETVLADFHVKGAITHVRPGPVVTMYELEPAPGIKASRVIALADDIARNMSAVSARVAVIPGRNVIGIELPNAKRESVSLHELIGSESFADGTAQLPLVLGKNIAGDAVVADLAPMPHLLVAGTTGSGKSVGLNSMILSLLYRLDPKQCRMIMIDPKMLELSMYEDIPHLLSPVVTDPSKAVRALKWAVETMEDRYRQMSSVGVRSLAGFNDKVRAAMAKGQRLGRRVQTGYHPDTGQPMYEEEQLDYEPLPQIVVIVDELADLMMTAGKEVEFLIQRLAQKARAAGIHLIMATQRPSVDVITGVIKANLPTRISFHVTSKIDSRTILGEQGAEQLLGRGDMLYMPGGKGIVRVHGPFVSDDEVRAVADHWRAQGLPDYISSVTEEPEDGFELEGAPTGEDSAEDQQYRNAIQLVCESRKASTSWLQRQLRIGYNSAARLIERMEKDGIVGRPDHVGRREVLRDAEGHAI